MDDRFFTPEIVLHPVWRHSNLGYASSAASFVARDDIDFFIEAVQPVMLLFNLLGFETPEMMIGDPAVPRMIRINFAVPELMQDGADMTDAPGEGGAFVQIRVRKRTIFGSLARPDGLTPGQILYEGDANAGFWRVTTPDGVGLDPPSMRQRLGQAVRAARETLIAELNRVWAITGQGYDTEETNAGIIAMYDPDRWSFRSLTGATAAQRRTHERLETSFRELGGVIKQTIDAHPYGIVGFLVEESQPFMIPRTVIDYGGAPPLAHANLTIHQRLMALDPGRAAQRRRKDPSFPAPPVTLRGGQARRLLKDIETSIGPALEMYAGAGVPGAHRPVRMEDFKRMSWTAFLMAMEEAGVVQFLENLVTGVADVTSQAHDILDRAEDDPIPEEDALILARYLANHPAADRPTDRPRKAVDRLVDRIATYSDYARSEIVRGVAHQVWIAQSFATVYGAGADPLAGFGGEDASGAAPPDNQSFPRLWDNHILLQLARLRDSGAVDLSVIVASLGFFTSELRQNRAVHRNAMLGDAPDGICRFLLDLFQDDPSIGRVVDVLHEVASHYLHLSEIGVGFPFDASTHAIAFYDKAMWFRMAQIASHVRDVDNPKVAETARILRTLYRREHNLAPKLAEAADADALAFTVNYSSFLNQYSQTLLNLCHDDAYVNSQQYYFLLCLMARFADPETDDEWRARVDLAEVQAMMAVLFQDAKIQENHNAAWDQGLTTLLAGVGEPVGEQAGKYATWLTSGDFFALLAMETDDRAAEILKHNLQRLAPFDKIGIGDVALECANRYLADRPHLVLASDQIDDAALESAVEQALTELSRDAVTGAPIPDFRLSDIPNGAKELAGLLRNDYAAVMDLDDLATAANPGIGAVRAREILANARILPRPKRMAFCSLVTGFVAAGQFAQASSQGWPQDWPQFHQWNYDQAKNLVTVLQSTEDTLKIASQLNAAKYVMSAETFLGCQGVMSGMIARTAVFAPIAGRVFSALPVISLVFDVVDFSMAAFDVYDKLSKGDTAGALVSGVGAGASFMKVVGGTILLVGFSQSWHPIGIGLCVAGGVISFTAFAGQWLYSIYEDVRVTQGIDNLPNVEVLEVANGVVVAARKYKVYHRDVDYQLLTSADGFFYPLMDENQKASVGTDLFEIAGDPEFYQYYPEIEAGGAIVARVAYRGELDQTLPRPGYMIADETTLGELTHYAEAGLKIRRITRRGDDFVMRGQPVARVRPWLSDWVRATEGRVAEVLVAVGDAVSAGARIAQVEAPSGAQSYLTAEGMGKVHALNVKVGQTVKNQDPVALIYYGYRPDCVFASQTVAAT